MSNAAKALVVDFDLDHAFSERIREILSSSSEIPVETRPHTNRDVDSYAKELRESLLNHVPTLTFLVFTHQPEQNRLQHLLTETRKLTKGRPVIVITAAESAHDVRQCFEFGASDVWVPPLKPLEVLGHTARWLNAPSTEEGCAARQLKERLGLQQIIGESPALLTVVQKLPVIARSDLSVLIRGETGTGKEVCARAIHHLSARSGHPFLALNCGGLPPDLVENELFGHQSGAYTSANTSSAGLVKQADGGTLFLDEVDSLAPSAQVKLLRFIQDKQYRPLGSQKTETADLRFITASNCDLRAAAQNGSFRQDLYYRIAVVDVFLPPLRERGQDVELLAQSFVRKYTTDLNKSVSGVTITALQKLRAHAWPGNVRELENVIARSILFATQSHIQADNIELLGSRTKVSSGGFNALKSASVNAFEVEYLTEMLRAHDGNITKAAAAAGKNRRAFWELLKKHRLLPQVCERLPANS